MKPSPMSFPSEEYPSIRRLKSLSFTHKETLLISFEISFEISFAATVYLRLAKTT